MADVSPRILLADDHALVRRTVRKALEGRGFEICAEVADAPGAVAAAMQYRPDVCLLDIHMPGDGVAAASVIGERVPDATIVMLTVSDDEEDLLGAVAAGATGYLLKDMEPERLPGALERVLRGEAVMPPTLVMRALRELRARSKPRRLALRGRGRILLSEQEQEIVELLRTGSTAAEIGEVMDMSHMAVHRHVAQMLRKLDLPDRKTAVRLLSPPTAG